MIAILLAVVIDSFTVNRAEKIKQNQCLSNACIICGIDRTRFNIESPIGFEGHQALNHNIFSYFSFRYMLTQKRAEQMTILQLECF